MGAHDFSDQALGVTADDAFIAACQQAEYEEGHNPYNGTISTNSSFVVIPLIPEESREDWERRVQDDPGVHKWGPCGCVADPDFEPREEDGARIWWFAGWAAC